MTSNEPKSSPRPGRLAAILRTLRPRQWVKNLFVAAPLVFSKSLTDPDLVWRAAVALLAFCMLSGAVYAFNDVRDREADRLHPTKRFRPIAAGHLSVSAALTLAAVLAGSALIVCAAIDAMLAVIAGGYLVNNLAYSLALKRIAFVDVALIAGGFLLRVLAGGAAIGVPISIWILICTGLLASLLGFGKRAHELAAPRQGEHQAREQRASLAGYNLTGLRWVMTILSVATVAAYALYTQDDHTVEFFGTRALIWTLPFCALGIGRFLQHALWRPSEDSPTDAILRDWLFMANLAAWGVCVLAIIYGYG